MKTMYAFAAATIMLYANLAQAQWSEVDWEQSDELSMIDFIDEETGYAYMHMLFGFASSLEKTSDGGQNWTEMPLPFNGYNLMAIDFFEDGKGVIIFRDFEEADAVTRCYMTVDDGENWSNITPTTTVTGYGNADVQFFDEDHGMFTVGESFYKTTDGGENWTETVLPHSVMSIHFFDADHGILGTWDGSFNYFGGMLTTTDGGETWTGDLLNVNQTVMGEVRQWNETTAYAAPVNWGAFGHNYFYKTTDNGETWTTVDGPVTDDNATLTSWEFVNENEGVVTVASNDQFYIFHTTNGGETWTQEYQSEQFYLSDLMMIGNSGYLTGNSGTIMRWNAPLSVGPIFNVSVPVYPNPALPGQVIRWQSEEQYATVRLIDITGKTVFNEVLNSEQFELPELNRGVYIVVLQNPQKTNVVKLTVE